MTRMILAAALLFGGSALAQTPMTPEPGADTPAAAANRQAMQRMATDMDVPATGNEDHDFVTGMLPHHRGAIDMARVELQYGHDPALRKLAQDIIASQAKEEVFMKQWLARHPASKP